MAKLTKHNNNEVSLRIDADTLRGLMYAAYQQTEDRLADEEAASSLRRKWAEHKTVILDILNSF